jgi:hypothetical protein
MNLFAKLLRLRVFFFSFDAKFQPAAKHALTQPRTSAEGARSVLPMRWGRSDSCLSSPTTRRHLAKPTRKSTGEGACHQMPGVSRCPVPLVPGTFLLFFGRGFYYRPGKEGPFFLCGDVAPLSHIDSQPLIRPPRPAYPILSLYRLWGYLQKSPRSQSNPAPLSLRSACGSLSPSRALYRPNMRLRLVCSFWWRKALLSKSDRPKKNAGGNSYFCWPATG